MNRFNKKILAASILLALGSATSAWANPTNTIGGDANDPYASVSADSADSGVSASEGSTATGADQSDNSDHSDNSGSSGIPVVAPNF